MYCQKELCDTKNTGEMRRISSLCVPIVQVGRYVAISGSPMPWLWQLEVYKLPWRSENVILLESELLGSSWIQRLRKDGIGELGH